MIQPKYEIGQVVFAPGCEESSASEECPDCLGSGKVEVHTPSGEIFPVACGMCSYGYFATGQVVRPKWVPYVMKATIGSVRIDTADENPVSYMCAETGIGSGRVWHELDLCTDESLALLLATMQANRRTEEFNAREAKRIADEKQKAKRKPSWEKRRIHELEKELKSLKAIMEVKS